MALNIVQYDGKEFPLGEGESQSRLSWFNQLHNPWSETNRTADRMLRAIEGGAAAESLSFRHSDLSRPAFCEIVRQKVYQVTNDSHIQGARPALEETPFDDQVEALYTRVYDELVGLGGEPQADGKRPILISCTGLWGQ